MQVFLQNVLYAEIVCILKDFLFDMKTTKNFKWGYIMDVTNEIAKYNKI